MQAIQSPTITSLRNIMITLSRCDSDACRISAIKASDIGKHRIRCVILTRTNKLKLTITVRASDAGTMLVYIAFIDKSPVLIK